MTNATGAPNCGASVPCDPLSRNTDSSFREFATATGYRTDGASVPGGFVDGSVAPITADRNAGGNVIGFQFGPPDSAKLQPGQISNVLVISTNATEFTTGSASVIDGGVTTAASFQPVMMPEPASLLLIGGGLIALGGARRPRG